LTELLVAWGDGDASALDRLAPLVQSELRRLASHYMRRERGDHLLQTSALINEAYLRLIDWKSVRWQNRAHFFSTTARMMRRVLVDAARVRQCNKRGAGSELVPLDDEDIAAPQPHVDLVALADALDALAAIEPRASRVVELRFFGGFSVEETAEALSVSARTVNHDWNTARAWLHRQLARTGLL
jgi:RNA polymerase sigma factor (TIGR02999 family)